MDRNVSISIDSWTDTAAHRVKEVPKKCLTSLPAEFARQDRTPMERLLAKIHDRLRADGTRSVLARCDALLKELNVPGASSR